MTPRLARLLALLAPASGPPATTAALDQERQAIRRELRGVGVDLDSPTAREATAAMVEVVARMLTGMGWGTESERGEFVRVLALMFLSPGDPEQEVQEEGPGGG